MSNSSHIQSSGFRRSAAVLAVVAAALSIVGGASAASSTYDHRGLNHVRPMPGGGGCSLGCRHQLRLY